ncbi:enoyl-CoA hydratase/isomerase family protein [Pantoea sp. At-9b]|uniref:enoyl-CoA hydratase/isomerase family protein n=1 Tax=Pantoea sp. (strain At-9b) TaxID=592316 RepID=UPI0001B3DEB4|nr:enoyl-CoA hydratase/isomerase family protein [Pantoea sp. At-9b]ADU71473.1 Enoyl-CoA hydratase/isomerase [Pantoea sp. At-9b]
MILETDHDEIRVITLNAENKHNPFSFELEEQIKEALSRANSDPMIGAVILYGGEGRSFSAGGDFNEVKFLSRTVEIENWIDRVIELYQSVLKVTKPTVAAIDGYAIGMGFQFAMMFDQRLMSADASLIMPELQHGIGCSVGAAILRFTHGFALMQEIIYQCKSLDAQTCSNYHLVNKVVDKDTLLHEAIQEARAMAKFPRTAFINTKTSINRNFIELLDAIKETSKSVHTASFQARDAQKHFCKVLKVKYQGE